MTQSPVTVNADDDLDEAARLMDTHEVRRLPVVNGNQLVGILSHGNLVQAAKSEGPADRATLGVTRGA
jgi:CBS domain-containing protein